MFSLVVFFGMCLLGFIVLLVSFFFFFFLGGQLDFLRRVSPIKLSKLHETAYFNIHVLATIKMFTIVLNKA